MADKKHCDVCDGTKGEPKFASSESVIFEHNGLMHEVRLDIDFMPKYRDEDRNFRDLCSGCQLKAYKALVAKRDHSGRAVKDLAEAVKQFLKQVSAPAWADLDLPTNLLQSTLETYEELQK